MASPNLQIVFCLSCKVLFKNLNQHLNWDISCNYSIFSGFFLKIGKYSNLGLHSPKTQPRWKVGKQGERGREGEGREGGMCLRKQFSECVLLIKWRMTVLQLCSVITITIKLRHQMSIVKIQTQTNTYLSKLKTQNWGAAYTET